jgi:hypothetical protein
VLFAYESLNAAGSRDPWFSEEAFWRAQVSISKLIAETSQPSGENYSQSIPIPTLKTVCAPRWFESS